MKIYSDAAVTKEDLTALEVGLIERVQQIRLVVIGLVAFDVVALILGTALYFLKT